mmetsp:Transcript_4348/g.9499  ORF Transcript_4348/g.9499 Transcript_4348/m.9499 type:complete len:566 (-) Transcript_4348:142-1839(-)
MSAFGGISGAIFGLALIPFLCSITFIAVYYLQKSGFTIPERTQLRSVAAHRLLENSTNNYFNLNENKDESVGSTIISTVAPNALDGDARKWNCTPEAVVISLYREDADSDESCNGLLVRDDIILTSRSCSRFNFTFAFPTGDVLTAFPHASLNSNEMVDSKLGFLEASPPFHYQFIDQAVRRNRLFLSLNDTSAIGAHVAMSCFGDRPIAHNFPVKNELISLGHLHRVLPEVLWEHSDISSAPGYIHNGQRWWSRRVTLQEEKEIMLKLFDKYRGPPGSIDIVSGHKEYKNQASAVLEAEDPRGHRSFYCYQNYYYRYRDEPPFSGEMFFDWLDFGSGKHILDDDERGARLHPMKRDKVCSKKNINREKIHCLNATGRLWHEVNFEMSDDGNSLIARYRQSGKLVPKSSGARHPHLYMWDLNETFFVADDTLYEERFGGSFKHTSILASAPGLSAGEVYVGNNGTVFGINYVSGHYRPSIRQTALMYQWFQKKGLNLNAFHWVGRQGWSTSDCATNDWTKMKIPGYDAKSLNQSCHAVTTCPTWIRTGKAVRLFSKQLKKLIANE